MKLNDYFLNNVSILKESTEEELKHIDTPSEKLKREAGVRRFKQVANENFRKAIVLELAYQALPLDGDVVHYEKAIKETMGAIYDEYLSEGAYDKSTETKFLIEAVANYLVETKAEKVLDNGIEEEYLKEVEAEDDLSIKNAAGEIDTKNITETIKKKVVEAVEKEQELAEQRKADLDEMSEAEKTEENEAAESVEEATLLKSIMIGKGKEVIREGLENHDVISEALVDLTILETMHTLKIMKETFVKTIKESYIFN